MKTLASLPVWQQYALCAANLFPWIALGVFSTDVLPEAWRFPAWPESIRITSVLLFAIFMVADIVFAFVFLFFRSRDDTTA